ncbi:hypothetical protein VHEMI02768 [[Torrubiella] hemipterigena]|uniref:Uncharacterized protein n=1 Tax=[Torrubiella] hemipterigena TaxID=1531966 RepID=A0A0A1TBI1_9HYPO|nr:hypothetical protein VHEMI02768 [[Torrubiella] hemipterigena]
MKRDLGHNAEQAVARVAHDFHASRLIEKLRGSVGPSFAGADTISAQGAVPVIMTTPLSKFQEAKSALDSIFLGHNRSKRSTNDAVIGFYVDEAANKVIFKILAHGRAQAEDLAKQAGVSASEFGVKIEDEIPTLMSSVRGGDIYHIDSKHAYSVGFSVNGGFISAAHCVKKGINVTDIEGNLLGTAVESSFGGEVDSSYIKTIDGTNLTGYVNSYGQAHFHCGTITAKNVTIDFDFRHPSTGLTETDVCAEPGDSGGSFFSGDQAQGTLSGGSGECARNGPSKKGQQYFPPINKSLEAFNLTLITA